MKIIKYILIMLLVLLPVTVSSENLVKEIKYIDKVTVVKIIKEIAKKEKVDKTICLTIAKIESDFRPWVSNPKDPSYGLYELAFGTAKAFNKDIKSVDDMYDVRKNATAGIRFIKHLLKTYPKATIYEIAQMYNLGETKYNKGVRNIDYKNRFTKFYKKFK